MAFNGADQVPLPDDGGGHVPQPPQPQQPQVNEQAPDDPRFNLLRDALHALAINVIQPPPRPAQRFKYDSKTFPRLRIVPGDDEVNAEAFSAWEMAVRATVIANGFPWPEYGYGIVATLNDGEAGKVAAMIRPLLEGGQVQTLDQLMETIRSKVVCTSYQAKAMAKFQKRIQNPKETIPGFHLGLQDLFNRAYPADQRIHNEPQLITQFIAGIRNREIQKALTHPRPQNYNDACTRALEEEGILETIDHYQTRIRNNGRADIKRDRHLPGDDKVRPMEMGNVNRARGYPTAPKAKAKHSSHPQKGGKNKRPNSKSAPAKQHIKKSIKCYNCGKKGHVRKNCRVRSVNCLENGTEKDIDGDDEQHADGNDDGEWSEDSWSQCDWNPSEN